MSQKKRQVIKKIAQDLDETSDSDPISIYGYPKLVSVPKPAFVRFQIKAETPFGDSISIIGSSKELGEWNTGKAVRLNTNPKEYPLWNSDPISWNTGQDVIYKYILVGIDGRVKKWEVDEVNIHRSLYIRHYPKHQLLLFDGEFGKITHTYLYDPKSTESIDKLPQDNYLRVNEWTVDKSVFQDYTSKGLPPPMVEDDYVGNMIKRDFEDIEREFKSSIKIDLKTGPSTELPLLIYNSARIIEKSMVLLPTYQDFKRIIMPVDLLSNIRSINVQKKVQADEILCHFQNVIDFFQPHLGNFSENVDNIDYNILKSSPLFHILGACEISIRSIRSVSKRAGWRTIFPGSLTLNSRYIYISDKLQDGIDQNIEKKDCIIICKSIKNEINIPDYVKGLVYCGHSHYMSKLNEKLKSAGIVSASVSDSEFLVNFYTTGADSLSNKMRNNDKSADFVTLAVMESTVELTL